MATNYGSCTDNWTTDMPLVWTQTTNPIHIVGQRVLRRLTTPRGALANIGDDPNFGWDVRQLVNQKLKPGDVMAAQSQIQAEALKDEEVQDCTATVTQAGTKLTIKLQLIGGAGPFTLTLNVSSLTVAAVFSF